MAFISFTSSHPPLSSASPSHGASQGISHHKSSGDSGESPTAAHSLPPAIYVLLQHFIALTHDSHVSGDCSFSD